MAVAVGGLSCINVVAFKSTSLFKALTLCDTVVIFAPFWFIEVCKPDIAVATVDDELKPVRVFCSSVTFVDNVLIVPPWFVTVPDNVLIASAFACKPVVEFVIEALRDVMFTDVDMSALSLTPATNNMSDAFCVIALPLDVI